MRSVASSVQPFLLAGMAPPPPPVGQLTPRDYQIEGIDEARRILAAGVKALLLVLATGGGKTVIAALVALGAVLKGKRVLFIGPRREIIAQAYWKLVEAGIPEKDMGVIMADGVIPHVVTRQPYNARRVGAPVQVASLQTLSNRRLPPADVVFVDEAHHATSPTWLKVIEHYKAAGAVVVGLTATPIRADGKGLRMFEHLHVIAGFEELAAKGYLVSPQMFTSERAVDLAGVRTGESGDYNQDEIARRMDRRELVGDIVENYQRRAPGEKAVVFAASVEHSKHIAAAFNEAGIPAGHIDGSMGRDERDAVLAKLRTGEILVVCNYGVLTEGWDEPSVSYVAIARPTKSESLFLQMAGRGLRSAPGKTRAILLDHAGNYARFDPPQWPREWTLDGKAPRVGGAFSVRTCPPPCCAVMPGGARVCEVCGYEFPVAEKAELKQVDGELVDVTNIKRVTMTEKVATYRAMLAEGRVKGNALGWCRHRYRDQFNVWPQGEKLRAVEEEFYPRRVEAIVARAEEALVEAAVEPVAAAPQHDPPAAPAPPQRGRRVDLASLYAEPTPPPAPATEEVVSWSM